MKFNFDCIGDLTNAKELQRAGFLDGSRTAIYKFLNRSDVKVVKIGRKIYVTKKVLMEFFGNVTA